MSYSVLPRRWQPTRPRCPWDSPGKNTGVGCHFLLQCMKVKSESEVAQLCQTLATPWTAAYQAPLSMGFSRQEYWSGLPLPSLIIYNYNITTTLWSFTDWDLGTGVDQKKERKRERDSSISRVTWKTNKTHAQDLYHL